MATRILCHDTGHEIGIRVHFNGFCVMHNGKDTPPNEIPAKYHQMIKINLQDVCKLNGWDDHSKLCKWSEL